MRENYKNTLKIKTNLCLSLIFSSTCASTIFENIKGYGSPTGRQALQGEFRNFSCLFYTYSSILLGRSCVWFWNK